MPATAEEERMVFVGDDSQTRGVVTAVFELLEPFD